MKPESNETLISGVRTGERRALAKAITLLESTRQDDRIQAERLLDALLPHTGRAMRIGISGAPGVGKSTFIEALGLFLIERNHRLAVLAVDPSSSVTGGSILADKTRMECLSVSDAAFIRPSPASGTLGGVAERTRETILVCEASGFDIVIVETVGVGQSETAVASMTDMFVVLQLPNAGDDLQAIKKGVMELADLVVINKSDLDAQAAARAAAQLRSGLRWFTPRGNNAGAPVPGQARTERQQIPVLLASGLKGDGLADFWQHVADFHRVQRASGELERRRRGQAVAWLWDIIHARLVADFRQHPAVSAALPQVLADVAQGALVPASAARHLLQQFEQAAG